MNICKLGDIAKFTTGKLNSNAAQDNGKYPFFTCAPEALKIDDYAFDTEAIILAGNNADGNFHIQHFKGKFNAYQRTYVIESSDENKVYTKYLYYALKTCLLHFKQISQGSATKFLTAKILNSFELPIPEIEIQKKIAGTLGNLDKKIKTNEAINENLADQAQAIYQQFFLIEADPNWPFGHLSDLINVKYGKDHKKLADGVYPVYGSGGIMRYVERPLYEKESVLIPRKGTLNNVMYVNQPFWSVDTMFYTEMKQTNVAKFVYHFVKSKDLASMNAGSAVPSMTTAILNALELRIPSAEALLQFENSVAPMYEMMKKNEDQSRKLTELRDALLPKLMSGEIDVSDLDL
ncbi:restriction endonuclease subunit S [Dorea formicigenerans]|uniref:restriction endonuclease subunit S n=1 Tax=Dorea formicigenerans TaxID=39486 RepID=UPI000E50A3E4|nr:restriction endonuclease subunit S [Dorea formicigenerans]RGT40879.1 restriction endonuclease subunit S [Dorea formicigenerans]RHC51670.1 restriction endonuclease subunit S [Dorea formicigenerans]DAK54979.1 MAG TPA: Type I restriction enzyme [Caudoviricetes sp.]